MLLTVPERLVLLELLPKEENYAGMREISRTRAHLSISGEEAKEIEYRMEGNMLRWNAEKAAQHLKDVPMGEWMTDTLREILREMNKNHKISEREMTIYEKFVIDYEQL